MIHTSIKGRQKNYGLLEQYHGTFNSLKPDSTSVFSCCVQMLFTSYLTPWNLKLVLISPGNMGKRQWETWQEISTKMQEFTKRSQENDLKISLKKGRIMRKLFTYFQVIFLFVFFLLVFSLILGPFLVVLLVAFTPCFKDKSKQFAEILKGWNTLQKQFW